MYNIIAIVDIEYDCFFNVVSEFLVTYPQTSIKRQWNWNAKHAFDSIHRFHIDFAIMICYVFSISSGFYVVYFLNTLIDTRGHIKNYVPQQSKNQYSTDNTIPLPMRLNGFEGMVNKTF